MLNTNVLPSTSPNLKWGTQPYYQGDKEIPNLQSLKCLCAFLVVQIHTLSPLRIFILPLCKLAVPIFLIITGYFLLSKDGSLEIKKVKKTLFKFIKLTLVAQFIYITYFILKTINEPYKIIETFSNLQTWINILFFGDFFGIHLWYLNAVIWALLTLIIILKLNIHYLLPFLIIGGILLAIIFGKYSFIFSEDGYSYELNRNAWSIALPLILIGCGIRKTETHLRQFDHWKMITIICLSLLFIEYFILQKFTRAVSYGGDLVFMSIPTAFSAFVLVLKSSLINIKLSRFIGKYLSLNIFVFHFIILEILTKICFSFIGMNSSILVFACSGLIAYLIEQINFKVIKNASRISHRSSL